MMINVRILFHLSSLSVPFLAKSKRNPSIVCITSDRRKDSVKKELTLNVAFVPSL